MHAHHRPPHRPPAIRRPGATLPALSSLQFGVPGGTVLFVKLTLSAAVAMDTPVALSTDDPTATLPGFVTVPAGQSFARFSVQTTSPPARHFLLVRATLAGVTRLQQITIEPTAPGPVLTAVMPTAAVCGATVTLSGQAFGPEWGGGQIAHAYCGSVEMPKQQWTETQIVVTVPNIVTSGSYSITIRRCDGATATGPALFVQSMSGPVFLGVPGAGPQSWALRWPFTMKRRDGTPR